MIKITWDHSFKRIYKKKIKSDNDLRNRFWTAIELFSKDSFSHRLRTHKLTGKLEGLWAFSVTYECRVIFEFLSKNDVLLIDIGGHDEVY